MLKTRSALLIIINLIEINHKKVIISNSTTESTKHIWTTLKWKKVHSLNIFTHLGSMKIAALLIENKANVNAENYKKQTPLHIVAQFGIFAR